MHLVTCRHQNIAVKHTYRYSAFPHQTLARGYLTQINSLVGTKQALTITTPDYWKNVARRPSDPKKDCPKLPPTKDRKGGINPPALRCLQSPPSSLQNNTKWKSHFPKTVCVPIQCLQTPNSSPTSFWGAYNLSRLLLKRAHVFLHHLSQDTSAFTPCLPHDGDWKLTLAQH